MQLHHTLEEWMKFKPAICAEGSKAQTINVMRMMQDDIRQLHYALGNKYEPTERKSDKQAVKEATEALQAQLTAAEKERNALREALDAATDFIKAQKAMADGKVVREYDHKKVRYEAALAATQQKEGE